MDVYEDLQDPERRLVLTNIHQFHEEEDDEKTESTPQAIQAAARKKQKKKENMVKKNSLMLSEAASDVESDMKRSIINKNEKLELEVKQHQEETDLFMATSKRWYIISVGNTYKFYWDLFVILLAIYNAIALPLQICFTAVEVIYSEN